MEREQDSKVGGAHKGLDRGGGRMGSRYIVADKTDPVSTFFYCSQGRLTDSLFSYGRISSGVIKM